MGGGKKVCGEPGASKLECRDGGWGREGSRVGAGARRVHIAVCRFWANDTERRG